MKSRKALSVVSIFSGAGGLDLGFEAAGFEHVCCVELDQFARETLDHNRKHWNLLEEGDVFKVAPNTILESAGKQQGEVDVLVGGPPCQPFSKSAYWASGDTKRLKDDRADTLTAMMNLVGELLPRVVVIENVKGFAYRNKDEAVDLIRKQLRRINKLSGTSYALSVNALNAVDYGVPQSRERIFLIAYRNGSTFTPPAKSHSIARTGAQRRTYRVRNCWDALGDLKLSKTEREKLALRGKWAELLPTIPEGENYLWHTERGGGEPIFGYRTRYWSFLLKLARTKPAWTLQANPGPATGPFHWENRHLSVREMCRLQTFPDSYEVVGKYRQARQQIGNAVPPLLAESIADKIRSDLLGKPEKDDRALSLSTRRCRVSAPATTAVPPHFKKLIGKHPEHPGTGKGPAAAERKSSKVVKVGRKGGNANSIDVGSKKLTATQTA